MKKQTITVTELAALASITSRRIRHLAEDGKLPKIIKGELPMPDAVKRLFDFYRRDSEQLQGERLALITANRKTKEHELAVAEDRYVERDVAARTIKHILTLYHHFVIQEVERHAPPQRRDKLTELGASPEHVAAFHEWDVKASQKLIDDLVDRCHAESNKPENML